MTRFDYSLFQPNLNIIQNKDLKDNNLKTNFLLFEQRTLIFVLYFLQFS